MDFEDIYSKVPDSLKLKFLDAIIAHNNKLREEFVAFARSRNDETSGLSYNNFLKIIEATQTDYQKRFEAVDLENPDWESYHSRHSGYVEEWEACQEAGEQKIEAIFDKFCADAINKIIEQHPAELTAMLIGLYRATQDAEITDEFETFENVNEYLLSEHTDTMNTLIEKLRLNAISENVIQTVFELFFSYCDSECSGNLDFANYFEHLLIVLAEKSDNAAGLFAVVDQSTIKRKAFPELILLLNKKTGNTTEWLQSARQFYRNSVPVAKQLLEYYFETDKDAFLKTAEELFATDNGLWAEFLQQYVSPELGKDLFVEVFRELTTRLNKIEYYQKIREYLSEDDLTCLVEEMKWNKVFIVKLFDLEKRYDDIKSLVEKHFENGNYIEIITPILTVYPDFCFRHIKNKVITTIQNQRGRHVYEYIASWLKLTEKIPGFENEKCELIQQLYNYKPSLPALKDEMRKTGVVK
jgi:hypothetical protein